MDMPGSKTFDIKGKKETEIFSFGADKVRVSLILAIAANGNKLPPLLIFKAKKMED